MDLQVATPLPRPSLSLMPFPHSEGWLPAPDQSNSSLQPIPRLQGRLGVGMKGHCQEPVQAQPQLPLAKDCWIVQTFILYSFYASAF